MGRSVYFGRPWVWTPPRGLQRPQWPFTLDRDRPDAQGLVACITPNGYPGIGVDIVNGRHFTIVGATTIMDPEMGFGWSFNGSSDYLHYPHKGSDLQPANITAAAWYRPESTSGSYATIFAQPYDTETTWNSPYLSWNIVRRKTETSIQWRITNGSATTSNKIGGVGNFVNGQLNHACLTYDGETFYGYVDGVQDVSGTNPSGPIDYADNPDLMSGQQSVNSPGAYFGGEIYELRMRNGPSSADEVARWADRNTRWDIYYPLGRRVYSFPAAGVVSGLPKGGLPLLGVGA